MILNDLNFWNLKLQKAASNKTTPSYQRGKKKKMYKSYNVIFHMLLIPTCIFSHCPRTSCGRHGDGRVSFWIKRELLIHYFMALSCGSRLTRHWRCSGINCKTNIFHQTLIILQTRANSHTDPWWQTECVIGCPRRDLDWEKKQTKKENKRCL